MAESAEALLETKFTASSGAVTVSAAGEIAGYASLYGQADQSGDQVMAGAFRASLARRGAAGVRMLWQHDPREPIGVWDEIRDDARGLWVRGHLVTEAARGREAAALVAAGAIDGLSIGYRSVKAEKAGAGRRLIELDLWEVSLVTFPMLTEARLRQKAFTGPTDAARQIGPSQRLSLLMGSLLSELRSGLSPD